MNIETKFELLGHAWVMRDNKPYEIMINDISIRMSAYPSGLNYGVDVKTSIQYKDSCHGDWYSEDYLYPSKEDLINSL